MAKEEEPPNSISFFFHHHHRLSSLSFRNSSIINKNDSSIFSTINKYIDNTNRIVMFREEGVIVIIVMLLLLIISVFIACKCKPWRYLVAANSSRFRTIKADDLERPLVSEDPSLSQIQGADFARTHDVEGAGHQSQGGFSLPRGHEVAPKQNLPSSSPQLTHSDSFILDIPDNSKDGLVDQTLRCPIVTNQSADEQNLGKEVDIKLSSRFDIEDERSREFFPKYTGIRRSILMLDVISGLSRRLRHSIKSTNSSRVSVTLGRVPPSDVLLKDSEVSGKHALINWNINKLKWELVDIGSLNGTFLNSKAIHHPHPGSRHWGDPVELSGGDIITLGTTSKILVQIASDTDSQLPFGVGVASDPMALRRGGRKLPMEDVCYYKWPLAGTDQFGLFGMCDGHGGAAAATSVSKIMPEMVAKILSDSYKREQVLTRSDASDVLREAFSQTEACINHYYEGCSATVLLIWADGRENFYAQCANVGDSACFIHHDVCTGQLQKSYIYPLIDGSEYDGYFRLSLLHFRVIDGAPTLTSTKLKEKDINGKQLKMTEDHRVTSYSERLRIQATGEPLRDGETRLYGLNLARMLGDKFLKEQDARFSSEPYISEVVCIHQASRAFALLASDGFWDVINFKKAVQLVEQIKEKNLKDQDDMAARVANFLLSEARAQRTKDNTSIMFLDFDSTNRIHSCKLDP